MSGIGKIIDHSLPAKLPGEKPDPKIGSRYFLPTAGGETYPCHVLGSSPRGILIQAGEDILIIERQSFLDFAIPFPPVKIQSIQPDGESRIIFVRYSFDSSWIDKLYNWYVGKFKTKVDVDI